MEGTFEIRGSGTGATGMEDKATKAGTALS